MKKDTIEQLAEDIENLRQKVANVKTEEKNKDKFTKKKEKHSLLSAIDKISKLKEFLKECQEIIEWYKADCGYKDLPTESILTKIEEVLK